MNHLSLGSSLRAKNRLAQESIHLWKAQLRIRPTKGVREKPGIRFYFTVPLSRGMIPASTCVSRTRGMPFRQSLQSPHGPEPEKGRFGSPHTKL